MTINSIDLKIGYGVKCGEDWFCILKLNYEACMETCAITYELKGNITCWNLDDNGNPHTSEIRPEDITEVFDGEKVIWEKEK